MGGLYAGWEVNAIPGTLNGNAAAELDIHPCCGETEQMDAKALPLDRMTLGEKLMTMEALWDDLCRDEEQIPVQDWHKQILDERQRQIDSGDARFVDWEEAKARIRARIS